MTSKVVNMIEYLGLSDSFPDNPTTFTQITLSSDLCIPIQKPSIQRIVKINSSVYIESTKVIKTPTGASLEGQILTGNKLIVHGFVKYVIIYVADDGTQTLNSVTFKVPFCKFIVLPKYFLQSTPVDVIPYLEDVCICSECQCCNEDSSRNIDICATLFLNVRFCCQDNKKVCCKCSCPKIIGISPVFPTTITNFKEVTIEDELVLPLDQECIDDLLSISCNVEVESIRLISTVTGTSLEGQNLSGCKLAVTLVTKDIILYSTSGICNTVQSASFKNKLCCAFIIVPCEINNTDIEQLIAENNIIVTPYVEDICAHVNENCNIFKCMTILLDVTTRCI